MKDRQHMAPALNELKGWYNNHLKQGDAISANSKTVQITLSHFKHGTLYRILAKCIANSNCKYQPGEGKYWRDHFAHLNKTQILKGFT